MARGSRRCRYRRSTGIWRYGCAIQFPSVRFQTAWWMGRGSNVYEALLPRGAEKRFLLYPIPPGAWKPLTAKNYSVVIDTNPSDKNIYLLRTLAPFPRKIRFPSHKSTLQMIDRHHAKLRKKEICKIRRNPNWPANANIRKAWNCNAAVAAEQVCRRCNRNTAALSMVSFLYNGS